MILLNNKDLNKTLGTAIAKFQNNYLLAQNQQGLLVVQLPQALQRLIKKQITVSLSEQNKLISKPVLIPFSINLNVNAESWLKENKNDLQQLGFEFAALGEKEIMVRQVPAMLKATDIKESINQFVDFVLNKVGTIVDNSKG